MLLKLNGLDFQFIMTQRINMATYTKHQRQDKSDRLAFCVVCEFGKIAPTYLRQAAREARRILDNTKASHRNDTKQCKRHALYKGVRKPQSNCRGCWSVYNGKHETDKK